MMTSSIIVLHGFDEKSSELQDSTSTKPTTFQVFRTNKAILRRATKRTFERARAPAKTEDTLSIK